MKITGGSSIILRDIKASDIKDRMHWEKEETEWKNWDGPWESEGLTEQQQQKEYELIEKSEKNKLLRLKNMKDEDIRYSFQIETKDEHKHIGWVSSYDIDDNYLWDGNGHRLAVGIDICDPSARGKGYGTEALATFIQYLYAKGVKEIYTQTWSGNHRMIALANRLGFTLVCRKKDFREVGGSKYDGLTFIHKDSLLLETDELIVRKGSWMDKDDLYQIYSDSEVMKFIEEPSDLDRNACFIQNNMLSDNPKVYVIQLKNEPKVIGHVMYHPYARNTYELGWILAKEYWDKGFAQQLSEKLIDRSKKNGIGKLVIECDSRQMISQHIAQKFGFDLVEKGDIYKYQLVLLQQSNDYLKYINYPIKQLTQGFRVNSDTVILGMFLDNLLHKTVLDIGTNTGALLLYAHYHKAGKLVGVDINKKALELAKENISAYTDDFQLLNQRIQDVDIDPVDVVICNPPFFNNEGKKKQELSDAMSDISLSVDELFSAIRKLMKQNGAAYLIYQAERFPEIYQSCLNHKLKIMKMQFVHDKKSRNASRVVLKLKVGSMSKLNVEKPIWIDQGKIEMDGLSEMEKIYEN